METDIIKLEDIADSLNTESDQIIKVMVGYTIFRISNIGGELTITKPRQLNGAVISIFPQGRGQIGLK